jgi:hypothetical protein
LNRTITILPGPATPSGSWGDAAEAFRPKCDFGDAPASYDPDPWSPAVHERDTALRLGPSFDREWTRSTASAMADSDGSDEDGMPFVQIFNPDYGNYLSDLLVYNNTGANATVCAWLDYDGDGLFEASEGITVNVPSSSSQQTVSLYWPSIVSPLTMGTHTFLRIRITSAENDMTTANATGYFVNGEVEDYRVIVNNFPLFNKLHSFNAFQKGPAIDINWKMADEDAGTKYIVQRRSAGGGWKNLETVDCSCQGAGSYALNDFSPLTGQSYYRLIIKQANGQFHYSQTIKVNYRNEGRIKILPNPASDMLNATVEAKSAGSGMLAISDLQGKVVLKRSIQLTAGVNRISLAIELLPDGKYLLEFRSGNTKYVEKLIVRKNK